ncbi:MAG: nucleotide pyrophosphohydrolase [Flavobacteriales bacterium]|nr:nucleotide pyrophosphohydrolase [Flavobacteriales bacterium]
MLSDQLLQDLLAFRKERDWEQFHNLRTLSTSIALEAAELMEHTQWATDAELPAIAAERREAIVEEIADIAILLSYLTHDLDVDLEAAVHGKLLKNAQKYPVEKAKGVATKYDMLSTPEAGITRHSRNTKAPGLGQSTESIKEPS